MAPAPHRRAVPVDIQFQAFRPTSLDVLPGETVEWDNISSRPHTVTADDDSFDSDEVEGGDRFERTFDAVGRTGTTAGCIPGWWARSTCGASRSARCPGLVQVGEPVDFEGRTADPATPVQIERSTGGGFETVGTVSPNADGTWHAELIAERTAEYRARTGEDVSQTHRLLVSDRRVIVRARRGRVSVRVVPSNPYQRVMLELRLRERFGWWPQSSSGSTTCRARRSGSAAASAPAFRWWTRTAGRGWRSAGPCAFARALRRIAARAPGRPHIQSANALSPRRSLDAARTRAVRDRRLPDRSGDRGHQENVGEQRR